MKSFGVRFKVWGFWCRAFRRAEPALLFVNSKFYTVTPHACGTPVVQAQQQETQINKTKTCNCRTHPFLGCLGPELLPAAQKHLIDNGWNGRIQPLSLGGLFPEGVPTPPPPPQGQKGSFYRQKTLSLHAPTPPPFLCPPSDPALRALPAPALPHCHPSFF